MECKDFACIIIIYLLFEIFKKKFLRENFKRKNNDLDLILQDGDGNVQFMKLKEVYDSIQDAKNEVDKYSNHMHNVSKQHTNAMHNHDKNYANGKIEERAKQWAHHYANGTRTFIGNTFIKKNAKIGLKSHGNNHYVQEDWTKVLANAGHFYNKNYGKMNWTIVDSTCC